MDRCPSELHHRIFSLACTDGGRIGCTLSLVSRRIHATSTPVRFYTVALCSLPRMRLFLDLLRTKPILPIVSHLFLDDRNERPSGEKPLEVVASIISIIAPSLVTLSGSVKRISNGYASVIPQELDLSLLRDLSLIVGSTWADSDKPVHLPRLTSLRRLHSWDSVSLSSIPHINAFTRAAPNLTQIRLSNITHFPKLASVLRNALDGNGEVQEGGVIVEVPAGLKHLVIQMGPDIDWGWCGTGGMLRAELHCELVILALRSSRVELIPERKYTTEECMEDWLDVVEGGDGCWSIPPREMDEQTRNAKQNATNVNLEGLDEWVWDD
ncbi:hypothetical protein BDY19DRAFT_1058357 [Irpex rosettiformis]|uniref:Uncharacterized protein n=1 Tax=Irpex rosettiformis TaxID=378272 RepID=A0ACB8TZJ8_9APHY|nr:hypothetical protein BDY19DRAFT_1058357 [Irpex rosettiformis]